MSAPIHRATLTVTINGIAIEYAMIADRPEVFTAAKPFVEGMGMHCVFDQIAPQERLFTGHIATDQIARNFNLRTLAELRQIDARMARAIERAGGEPLMQSSEKRSFTVASFGTAEDFVARQRAAAVYARRAQRAPVESDQGEQPARGVAP